MSSDSTTPQKSHSKTNMIINKLLACGKFPVYHAHTPNSKAEYALKIFPQDRTSSALFNQELKSLTILNHPHIVRYVSHSKMRTSEGECNILITEYAPYGDFLDLVTSNKLQADERLARHFFHQLISGLDYLHNHHHLAHCDLKLENLLIGKDGLLKIADFDQARTPQDSQLPVYGTENSRAPEVIEGTCENIYSADIYSVGVILYVLVTGEMPFAEVDRGAKGRVIEGYKEFCEANEAFWDKKAAVYHHNAILRSEDFRALINGLLDKRAERRLSLEQVKESKWFRGQLYEKGQLNEKLKAVLTRKC